MKTTPMSATSSRVRIRLLLAALLVAVLVAGGARPAAAGCGFGPDCGNCQTCACLRGICGCIGDANACDDHDACTADLCNPFDGQCSNTRAPGCCSSDADCEDGDLCTTSRCIGAGGVGVCSPQTTTSCDDGSGYTDDSCDPSTGECRHTTAVVHCGGVNDCPDPIHDLCNDGLCERFCSVDTDCPTAFKCAGGLCLLGDCRSDADCDDHRACDGVETCDGRRCVPGTPVLCADDGNPCTIATCTEARGCVEFFTAGSCDDGNVCTSGDHCENGTCQGAPACDDGDPCTADSCLPRLGGACLHRVLPQCIVVSTTIPTTTSSSTTTSTSTTSTSSTTIAPECTTVGDCNDGDACTTDSCSSLHTCRHAPLRNFAAITCLCGDPPPACGGRVPKAFAKKFQKGCTLTGTAAEEYGRDAVIMKPQLTRAMKKFRKSCRAVDRAEHAHKIVPACAAALRLRCGPAGDKTNNILLNGIH